MYYYLYIIYICNFTVTDRYAHRQTHMRKYAHTVLTHTTNVTLCDYSPSRTIYGSSACPHWRTLFGSW